MDTTASENKCTRRGRGRAITSLHTFVSQYVRMASSGKSGAAVRFGGCLFDPKGSGGLGRLNFRPRRRR